MKIVVIGGTGLIGSRTVARLRHKGHDVVAASPDSGVNTITGQGLAAALAGASVVVDLTNSPTFDEKPALEFFETSGRNLFAAEKLARVRHHVALSVVGSERLVDFGYFRGKLLQEKLVRESQVPFTIVRSTQFFEFTRAIAQSNTENETVHLSPALMQPIAADDVAEAIADVALAPPVNGTIEIGGPEQIRISDVVERFLRATKDARSVVVDSHARYFGVQVNDQTLVPAGDARLGSTRFDSWLSQSAPPK